MAKQWKKSLEQTDIVSDGTPFDGANIDAPISSAGTTQETIADGADESDGRWASLISTVLVNSQPTFTRSSGSGATPNFNNNGMDMASGSANDRGSLDIVGTNAPLGATNQAKTVLVRIIYGSDVGIGTLSDDHAFGILSPGAIGPGGSNDIAAFLPHNGDASSGNVRVDSGGTDFDGSVSYPSDITEMNSYVVLVDYAGEILNAGKTGFYVNGDPRLGDAPDETISATPGSNTAALGYSSNGNGHGAGYTFFEVSIRV